MTVLPPASKATFGSPVARGPIPSLALSVTNTHACYFSSSTRSLAPLLSWLLPGPLPLPGAFPSLLPFPIPALSGPSQTEAEIGEYDSFLCLPHSG